MKIQVFCILLIFILPYGTSFSIPYDRMYWPEARIVGGDQTNITQYPHIASLQRSGRHICGCNIISDTYVLTAAHCTYGSIASFLSIRVGSDQHMQGGEIIQVEEITQHSRYDPNIIDYDFSILKLKKPLKFTNEIQPIRIMCQEKDFEDGKEVETLGWGNTQNSSITSDILRVVKVGIINQSECAKMYSQIGAVITDRMVCAGLVEGGKDACQGDSGGPLSLDSELENRALIGLVSWGYGCARPNYPGVYSRISAVSDWIINKTGLKTCYELNKGQFPIVQNPLIRKNFI